MNQTSQSTHAGQAVYNRAVLRIYDLYVLGFSNHLVWRCPTSLLVADYHRHLSDTHLDVGVGTGYYLERARFPVERPRVVLLDLNPQCLRHCADRISRLAPELVQGDVLRPIELPPETFGSIGLSFLIHCLPGGIPGGKWQLFDHLAPLLRPGGVLFGSTLLGAERPLGVMQRMLLGAYNRRGIFGNLGDSEAILRRELEARFARVELEVTGLVARFAAWEPYLHCQRHD